MFHKTIIIICALITICSSITGEEPFKHIMTEELPPYNYQVNGIAQGECVEMVLDIMQTANYKIKRSQIQFVPWVRGYYTIQNSPQTILFSMARTAEREKMFKWVGPISNIKIGLISLKKRRITIDSLEDIKRYNIGTVRDGAPEQLLIKQSQIDHNSLVRVASPVQSIKQLVAGRTDIFPFNVMAAKHIIENLGLKPDDFEVTYTLKEIDLYMALSKDTDNEIITNLKEAFKTVKKREQHQTITISGHPDYPPFMWKKDNTIIGAGADLVKLIFNKLKVPYKISYAGPWKRVLESSRSGEIDLIVGLYKNDERQSFLDYTLPYASDPTSISIVKGTKFSLTSRNDLISKTGITISGESFGQELDTFVNTKLNVIRAQTSTSMIKNLIGKRVDYMLWGDYPTIINIERLGVQDQIELLTPPLVTQSMYIAFSKKSPFKSRIDEVNEAITLLKKDGTIDKLIKEHLKNYTTSGNDGN